MDRATVPVGVVTSRTGAELIVGFLHSNGVWGSRVGDDAGGQEPQLHLSGCACSLPAPMKPPPVGS